MAKDLQDRQGQAAAGDRRAVRAAAHRRQGRAPRPERHRGAEGGRRRRAPADAAGRLAHPATQSGLVRRPAARIPAGVRPVPHHHARDGPSGRTARGAQVLVVRARSRSHRGRPVRGRLQRGCSGCRRPGAAAVGAAGPPPRPAPGLVIRCSMPAAAAGHRPSRPPSRPDRAAGFMRSPGPPGLLATGRLMCADSSGN